MAPGAVEILEGAGLHENLADAVGDCLRVVGFTARRGQDRPLSDVRELGEVLHPIVGGGRIALVFGREDRGLTNRHLDLCQELATIPTASEHRSLNLAQAVLLACYEIRRVLSQRHQGREASGLVFPAQGKKDGLRGNVSPARFPCPSADLEGLLEDAISTLLGIGYLREEQFDRQQRILRRIAGKAALDSQEVRFLRGILRKVRWWVGRAHGLELELSAHAGSDGSGREQRDRNATEEKGRKS